MAEIKNFYISHTQVLSSDTFSYNLGSTNQILTFFTASSPDATIGLNFLLQNSIDNVGTGALTILGYGNSTPLTAPEIYQKGSKQQYIFLPYQYLYFTTNTTVGEITNIYGTILKLDNSDLLDKIKYSYTVITTDAPTTILAAPSNGKYNVKSVFVYQSIESANACQLFVNDIPVSENKSTIGLLQADILNDAPIVLQPTQALKLKSLNSISSLFVYVTYTEVD